MRDTEFGQREILRLIENLTSKVNSLSNPASEQGSSTLRYELETDPVDNSGNENANRNVDSNSNFYFLRFSVKEIGFPSREGDFFVAFGHIELARFFHECGNYLISVFRLCASFQNFPLVKEYPLAFTVDFGLRKVVSQGKTRVAIMERYRKKF